MIKAHLKDAINECCIRFNKLRKYPLTHLSLNIVSDPSFLSGIAATYLAWPLTGDWGALVRDINIAGVIVYGSLRGYTDNKRIKANKDMQAFLEPDPDKPPPEIGLPPIDFRKLIPAEKPPALFAAYSRILNTPVIKKVLEKPQLLAQTAFQTLIVGITSRQLDSGNPRLSLIFFAFALAALSNILFILKEDPATIVARKIAAGENEKSPALAPQRSSVGKYLRRAGETVKAILLNPYLPCSLVFVVSSGAKKAALSDLSYALYITAVLHSVLMSKPESSFSAPDPNVVKKQGWLPALAAREDFSALILAAGCFVAAAQDVVSGTRDLAGVMGLYSMTCLSLYALLRWKGVAEVMDAFVAHRAGKKAERPARNTALPVAPTPLNID